MSTSARSFLVVFLLASLPVATRAADFTSGVVVDQQGRPLPRAELRAVDGNGAETAHVFADEGGQFRLPTSSTDCRVVASLTGFQPASAACSETPLRLALRSEER